jgi:hypothetical protein
MNLQELEQIFRFQTTATEEYTPKDSLDYMIFEGQDKLVKTHSAKDLAGLLSLLSAYQFEGYRDRTPLFIKPEVIIPL